MSERRKILIVTNVLQAATVLVFSFIFSRNLFLVYGVAAVYSFLNQFYVPAEAASLPHLVTKEKYPFANGMFFLTQQASLIFGYSFAGIMFASIGFQMSIVLCSIFMFIAFLSVLFLPRIGVRDKIPHNFETAIFKFFRRILEGYNFIKESKVIWAPFMLLLVLQAILAVLMVNIPALGIEIFGVKESDIGLRLVSPAGLGAAIGALIVPKILKKGIRKKRVVDGALSILIVAIFVVAFLVSELTPPYNVIVSTLSLVVMGLTFISLVIPAQTLIQEKVPGGYMGRVFGNFWFLATIITIVPVIFSGAISELFGIRLLMLILAGVILSILIFSKKKGEEFIMNEK